MLVVMNKPLVCKHKRADNYRAAPIKAAIVKHMFKNVKIRESDEWVYAVSAVTAIFGAFALYAGTNKLRLIAGSIALFGLALTTNKLRLDYGMKRAKLHFIMLLFVIFLLFLLTFLLTN